MNILILQKTVKGSFLKESLALQTEGITLLFEQNITSVFIGCMHNNCTRYIVFVVNAFRFLLECLIFFNEILIV